MTLTEDEINDLLTLFERYCENEVSRLCQQWPREKQSLVIDYTDLYRVNDALAYELVDDPEMMIQWLRDTFREDYTLPTTDEIDPHIAVQGSELEKEVDELRRSEVGKYVCIHGQVSQLTQVEPYPEIAAFACENCGTITRVPQSHTTLDFPEKCEPCEGSYGWTLDDGKTDWADHQIIELGILPESGGTEVSSSIRVEVENDLAGIVGSGDRVKISGILRTDKEDLRTQKNPDARRPLWLEGYAIQNEQETFEDIEPERIDEIKELADDPDLFARLVHSYAPHIQGREREKLALILQLFGGVHRELPGGSSVRGNINTLFVGDTGTAKSQLLKTANTLAPKSVYASGKGATAAGLTATAEQSNLTGEWTLKAGALVLANNGLACIDEFDKMDDSARKSVHEALENQEIPVTKAGMNTTLPARTAVCAAANPVEGNFDRYEPLSEQIGLGPTLISRFDLVFGLQDKQDEDRDNQIAESQHSLTEDTDAYEPEIDYGLLREYIAYARQIEPEYVSEAVKDQLVGYYVDKREESADESGSPIGPRMNDSLRRLAQASARARLSDEITQADAERAMDFMNETIGNIALNEDGEIDGGKFDGKSDYDQLEPQILDAIGDNTLFPDDIAGEIGVTEHSVRSTLERMAEKGRVIERNGKYEVNE